MRNDLLDVDLPELADDLSPITFAIVFFNFLYILSVQYIYIYTHMYIYIYIHKYIYIYIHTSIYTYIIV